MRSLSKGPKSKNKNVQESQNTVIAQKGLSPRTNAQWMDGMGRLRTVNFIHQPFYEKT